ncbi:MAG: sugar transferase [Planctomycetes bacterium]|nr:sugar transferase [Planctomycetota bacterium]
MATTQAPQLRENFVREETPDSPMSAGGHGSDANPAVAANPRSQSDPVATARVPAWKRGIDFLGALILLTILSPLFLAIAVLIKIGSPGPILFRQRRFGLAGRSFRIWKFRTMLPSVNPGAHSDYVRDLMNSGQALQKLDMPQQLIPGGSLLRASGIDELPQLVNVLLGQMSLVGPRPDVIPLGEYQEHQRPRFQVLPGITGLWQVSGKNRTTFEQMIELDVQYAGRCSPWLDIKILLLTGPAVLRQCFDKLKH